MNASCLQEITKLNSKSTRLLLLEFVDVTQSIISYVLHRFSKVRDYHNKPPSIAPLISIADFVASAVNASLMSTNSLQKGCELVLLKKLPIIRLLAGENLQKAFLHKNEGIVSLLQLSTVGYNFMYCSQLRNTRFAGTSPFQESGRMVEWAVATVWICLGMSIILISLILRMTTPKMNFSFLLLTLSSLISAGILKCPRVLAHSGLLTLWTVACLIFVAHYGGEITSEVISPGKEWRMTRIKQACTENYSVIGTSGFVHSQLLSALRSLPSNLPEDDSFLEKIMQKYLTAKSEQDMYKQLTDFGSSKLIFIGPKYPCINILNNAHEYMARKGIIGKCYVGNKIMLHQVFFYAATSMDVGTAKVIRTTAEHGFENMWRKEFQGVTASNRVQSRIKVRSTTNLLEETPPPKAINLSDGKLKNVFLLWAACLGLDTLVATFEVLSRSYG